MTTLYHYSSKEYDTLKTIRKLESETANNSLKSSGRDQTNPLAIGPYIDSISFFTEPVPLNISEYNGDDHWVWKSGAVLYQHEVSIQSLRDFQYHFVETPFRVACRDCYKASAAEDTRSGFLQYCRLTLEMQRLFLEVGNSVPDLLAVCNVFENSLVAAFKARLLRDDFKAYLSTYAGRIPHVMIYPKSGTIRVAKTKKITLS